MAVPAIVMVFECLICSLLSPTSSSSMDGVSIVLLIINTILVMSEVTKSLKKNKCGYLSNYVLWGLFFRIALLIWDYYARDIFVLPNSEADAVGYHRTAISYAFGSKQGRVDLTDYSFYVGLLYKAIGVQKITAQFINIYLSISAIVLIVQVMSMMECEPKAKITATKIMCFLPNLAIINSILLQETIVSFFLVAAVYCYTKWWKTNSLGHFIFSLVLSICGSLLHMGGMVAAIGIIVTYPFVKKRKLNVTTSRLIVALGIAFVAMLVITQYGGGLLGKIGGNISADSIVSNSGQTDRVSDADYLVGDTGMSSTASLILLTPIRMIYFVCSPLPWMWRGISDIIAFFGSALFYIVTVRKAWGIFKYITKEDGIKAYMFTIIVILVMAAFMFGWGVSNTGTALRHREKFTFLCALLYGLSFDIEQRRIKHGKNGYGNSPSLLR